MTRRTLVLMGVVAILAFASIAFTKPPMPPGPPGQPMAGPPPMGHHPGPPPMMGPHMGPPPPPPFDMAMGGPDEGPLGMLKEELGITDQQKKQLRLLFAGFLDRTRKTRMALMGVKDEHRAMMMTGTADLKKLAQLDEQEVKLMSEVMSERFKMRRDRLALLTPEQVEKMASIMSEKRPPHGMPPPPPLAKGGKDKPEKGR